MQERLQQPVADPDQLAKKKKKQNIPVCPHRLPPGELQFYGDVKPADFTEPLDEIDKRNFYREAAAIHKKVRVFAREIISPGVSLFDVTTRVEAKIRELCGNKTASTCILGQKSEGHGYYCGQAFPCGTSVNECAAHYAALPTDDHIVEQRDIVKVDFGIHCNGFLVDSAFSMHWDPELDDVCRASQEATDVGIKTSGVDVCLSEVGEAIEEVICSFEYKGKKMNPVRNLSGHMVDRYTIHAGKSIPLCKKSGEKARMEAGEVYACETFASTGKGMIQEYKPTSHFMVSPQSVSLGKAMIQGTDQTRELFQLLKLNFHTLAFNPTWIQQLGFERYQMQLDSLVKSGVVNDYPKLVDKFGCYVSQFEHTYMIGEWGKEVFTRGDDY